MCIALWMGFCKKLKFHFKYLIILFEIVFNVLLRTYTLIRKLGSKMSLSYKWIIHYTLSLLFNIFWINRYIVNLMLQFKGRWIENGKVLLYVSPLQEVWFRIFFVVKRIQYFFRFSNECTLHTSYGSINVDVRLHSLQYSNVNNVSSFKLESTLFGPRL